MFAEDVAKSLFPTGGDVDREAAFQLSSNDDRVSRIVESAFARFGGGYGRTLSSILSGFGNQTARSLVSCGSETFEIAPRVDPDAQTIGFAVLRVDGARSFAGVTWQMIPRNALAAVDRENPSPVNRRLVWIPQERVVQMKLPRQYKRIPSDLKALRHMGRAVPDFAIHNRNPDGTLRVPYDLQELTGIEQRAVATITRSTGWRGRGTFGDAVTSYYTMCRFLRFEEFKIRLRETVVSNYQLHLGRRGCHCQVQRCREPS